MSEQTEEFKIATEENVAIVVEPPTVADDEELTQEVKDGIHKTKIDDFVNKMDEKVNKTIAEKSPM